jgi:hypothetical protein
MNSVLSVPIKEARYLFYFVVNDYDISHVYKSTFLDQGCQPLRWAITSLRANVGMGEGPGLNEWICSGPVVNTSIHESAGVYQHN